MCDILSSQKVYTGKRSWRPTFEFGAPMDQSSVPTVIYCVPTEVLQGQIGGVVVASGTQSRGDPRFDSCNYTIRLSSIFSFKIHNIPFADKKNAESILQRYNL